LWFVIVPLWLYSSLQFLWDDYRLRDSGTVASSASVSNYRESYGTRNGGGGVNFDLSYVTLEGTRYTPHVALYARPDRSSPILVRYDPASPTHFSTNWSADLLFSRTLGLGISVLFFMCTMLGLILSVRAKRRSWRWTRSMPRPPQSGLDVPTPVAASLVNIDTRDKHGFVHVRFAWMDVSGRSATGATSFGSRQEPFWLDPGKSRMLALVWPSGHALVLDSALACVELSGVERRRIVEGRNYGLSHPTIAFGLGRMRGDVPVTASSLRQAAEALASALAEIVSKLLSEVPARPAALGIVSRLGPLVESYRRAVFETRSREDAGSALESMAITMTEVIAESNEGKMHFGTALKTYSDLKNLFCDSKDRNQSL
jgi:hypothetical protein